MGAQGVHLGGSLLVKGAEERKEEAVLVEPSRPSACVDHALLQSPARTSGSLDLRSPRISLSIFFLSLWLFIFSTFAAFASALHRFFSGWAGVGPGRFGAASFRLPFLPLLPMPRPTPPSTIKICFYSSATNCPGWVAV